MKEKVVATAAIDAGEVGDDLDEEEAILAVEQDLPVVERWQDVLLIRQLSPDGFEKFVLYLLRLYGLELERDATRVPSRASRRPLGSVILAFGRTSAVCCSKSR